MNGHDGESAELLQAQALVWNHSLKFISSMGLKCAVQLGIPDIIHSHGQPMSLSNLATALHVQPSKAQSLGRLMRLLVHSGFFAQTQNHKKEEKEEETEEEEVKYSLTPPSLLLLHKNKMAASPLMLLNLDQALMAPWEILSSWFCTSDDHHSTAFAMANGRTTWDHAALEPAHRSLFHHAMECDSALIAQVVTRECEAVFDGLKSLVDVGGGTGVMAKAIADAFPHISCTVFDLPGVVAELLQVNTKNLSFVGGDMFHAKIPPANAVLLKWILHNWNDEESIKILKKCKEAIPSKAEGGKVIIIDMVVGNMQREDCRESAETQLFFDLLMMVNFNGKERSEKEWENLFSEAGFSGYKIISSPGLRSLIEVYP